MSQQRTAEMIPANLTMVNLFDGELVQDNRDATTLCAMPTFLVFDCLVVGRQNVMHLNFRDRLKAANDYILPNFSIYR